MTLLLSLLAGLAGAAIGWVAAAAVTILLGGHFGISDFEGGRGMLAIWGIGPLGGLAGLVLGIVLVLRKRGRHSVGGIAWRLPVVIAGVIALAAGVLWWMHETRPVLNTNGPAPQLAFEVRLPPGLPAPPAPNGAEATLHTERNHLSGRISRDAPRTENGRVVLAGDVEVYYRSRWRILEFKMPGQDDRLFTLDLPASPRSTTSFGRWERAAHVAKPGLDQPRPAGPDEGYEIRYRMIWPE